MTARTVPPILVLTGAVVALTALFAHEIGLDHNDVWGNGRSLLLGIGALLITWGLFRYVGMPGANRMESRIRLRRPGNLDEALAAGGTSPEKTYSRRTLQAWILAGLGAVLVGTIYVWFVSVGYWTSWPKTTHTYDLLGTAFSHGQISLEEMPDAALRTLPNPYDPIARKGIQYPWDASLFGGRYYLYWGPVPGLVLALIKIFYVGEIADQYLVFGFVFGVFVLSMFLALALWNRHFRDRLPAGTVLPAVLVLGLICPSTWLLNRPSGYEAAIAGGQFFLLAGLYFAYVSFTRATPSAPTLILAGACWALAVGSRASTVIAVVVFASMTIVRMMRRFPQRAEFLRSLASLATPMVLGAIGLATYNWARFGSILEFGLRYQLTVIDFNRLHDQAFSIRYIADNLRGYLLNPFRIGRLFPFVTALPPQVLPPGPARGIAAAEIEPVAGLLLSSPFLALALVPIQTLLAGHRGGNSAREAVPERQPGADLDWIAACLAGSSVLSFAFLLMYFYPTMRQLEDVVPCLALLAVLGFWQGCSRLEAQALARSIYVTCAIALAVITITGSSLLAVTSYDNRFLHLNRELLRQLIHFFGR